MTLRLIVGKANAGKTGVLHRAVEDAVTSGRRGVLVLPSRPDVSRAREEFAGRTPVGAEITTFEDWLEGLWAANGDGRRLVSATSRNALTAQVATTAQTPLAEIAASRGLAGLVAQIAERSAGATVTAPSVVDHADLAEVARLVGAYQGKLRDAGFVEPAQAAELLAAGRPLEGATVAFNRFTDLSAGQEALAVGLSADNDVIVSLTWEEGFAPTEALDDLVGRLKAAGAVVEAVRPGGVAGELGLLAETVFSDAEALEPTGEVVLMEAAGAEAEASLVASAVRGLLDEGFSADQIAVVFREPFARLGLLERAFAAEGVPLAADVAMPFARTPLGRALLSLISVASGVGGRADLVSFLLSPYSGAPAAAVHGADAEWRRRRQRDPFVLLRAASGLMPEVGGVIRLAQKCAAREGQIDVGKWQELGAALIANAWTVSQRSAVDRRLDARAYERLVSGAAELSSVGAKGGLTLEESLRNVTVSTGLGEQPGAVTLTEARRLRSRRFDALVVGGLTATEFSSERPEPLVAGILREFGCGAGVEERLSERHLFYTLVSRARLRLILARQSEDASGQLVRASAFWDEVVDRYRTPEDVLNERSSRLSVGRSLPLSCLAQAAPAFSAGRRNERKRCEAAGAGPGARQMGRVDADALLGSRDEFSVTEVEAYIRCPQSWFRERVVRPGSIDAEFGARETGTFVHELLAGFYARFKQAGLVRVDPDNVESALAMFDEVASEMLEQQGWKADGLAEELAIASAIRQARGVVSADALLLEGFVPTEFEWRFGTADARPFDLGGIRLKGSIDRVDCGPRGVVVTDYKSSEVVGLKSFEQKGVLQPVVYAAAVAAHLGGPAVGGVYRSVKSGAVRGFWNVDRGGPQAWLIDGDAVDGSAAEALLARATEKIAAAIAGMRAGDVAPNPLGSACEYCSAAPSCSRGRS